MTNEDDILVTVQDCRKLGYCMKAIRPWFTEEGLDFRDFVRNGILASKLHAKNNAYAEDVIRQARKRIEG